MVVAHVGSFLHVVFVLLAALVFIFAWIAGDRRDRLMDS